MRRFDRLSVPSEGIGLKLNRFNAALSILVTGVLLTPLLNPAQVAEDIATLDHIARGRLVFGIGLGYRAEEFEAAGAKMSERVPRFEEGLALMKRLGAPKFRAPNTFRVRAYVR